MLFLAYYIVFSRLDLVQQLLALHPVRVNDCDVLQREAVLVFLRGFVLLSPVKAIELDADVNRLDPLHEIGFQCQSLLVGFFLLGRRTSHSKLFYLDAFAALLSAGI